MCIGEITKDLNHKPGKIWRYVECNFWNKMLTVPWYI